MERELNPGVSLRGSQGAEASQCPVVGLCVCEQRTVLPAQMGSFSKDFLRHHSVGIQDLLTVMVWGPRTEGWWHSEGTKRSSGSDKEFSIVVKVAWG